MAVRIMRDTNFIIPSPPNPIRIPSKTTQSMNPSNDNKDESNYYEHNKQLQAQVRQLQIMVANLVNISTEYNEYKQSTSNEMASMVHKLQIENDKLQTHQSHKSNECEHNQRLDALKNENDNLKQQAMVQKEYTDKLQKENDEMKQTIDENKTLQSELLNVIDSNNEYEMLRRLQESNNDELLSEYSHQLNEFQTMVIDMRNTQRQLTIENDSMKQILSDPDLHPSSSNIVSATYKKEEPNQSSDDKPTVEQTNITEVTKGKPVETETLIEKQEEVKIHASPPENNDGGCCVVL